ncbi:MAG: helix-turn-helix transcriptional regulator [Ruminococcaceae bacterium]|nr:helix-turn-helix transcriptional regulator [Oscillospiraceae bacterium]
MYNIYEKFSQVEKEVGRVDNRIRDLREDHDYSQQRVADALGITQRKYSYLETGVQQWTDELLVKLSRFYAVSIDYLLMQTNCPERYED